MLNANGNTILLTREIVRNGPLLFLRVAWFGRRIALRLLVSATLWNLKTKNFMWRKDRVGETA